MKARSGWSTIGAGVIGLGLLVAAPAGAAGSNPNETVDTTMTASDLAQTLVGPGLAISNVQYTGASDARGTFTFVDPAVVGMAQGVILSSGNAHDVVGPNTSDSYSTDWVNPGDADLDMLSGNPTYDAAVLEFDFIPNANQVSFQYAFSSDEYSEYVNTQYNDVFAFFINGTNCAEVRQIAGDPTAPFVPVAVNDINNSNPVQAPPPTPMRPDLFRANDFDPSGLPSAIDLELDGITRVLTCQAAVDPGVTNHMKLAIADASDGILDSAVFIQAGSLVSNENPTADLGIDPSAGTAPLDVTATVEGHDPNGHALTYTIDWGDGASTPATPLPDLTATATHTYDFGGSYVVTLTVSNGTLSGADHEDVDVTGPPPSTSTSTTTTATASTTTTTALFGCGAVPASGCQPAAPTKGQLQIRNGTFSWMWASSPLGATLDFGSPTATTDYAMCVYDAAGATLAALAPAGGTCGRNPCWKTGRTGFKYADKFGTPDGLTKLILKASTANKGKLQVKGVLPNLHLPVLPLTTPVRAQLVRSGSSTCWEATYSTPTVNMATAFKAKSD